MNLEKLFHLKENQTDVRTEVMAGITTFMTMAYILAVNPSVLSSTGMDSTAVLLATALAPAPEAVLGFGLDHKGRPRVDGLWPAFLHAAELRQSNAPFNLADMFRMTGAPLLGGLSGRLLSQPGSGLLSELAPRPARRPAACWPTHR